MNSNSIYGTTLTLDTPTLGALDTLATLSPSPLDCCASSSSTLGT